MTQEGRDALRSPQAHAPARPVAPPRTQWRQRRVPPRGNRPEPQETRGTDPRRTSSGLKARPNGHGRTISANISPTSSTRSAVLASVPLARRCRSRPCGSCPRVCPGPALRCVGYAGPHHRHRDLARTGNSSDAQCGSSGEMNLKSSAGWKFAVWSPARSGLPSSWSLRGPEPSEKSSSASFVQMMLGLFVSW